jgi:hypothetical protein
MIHREYRLYNIAMLLTAATAIAVVAGALLLLGSYLLR